MFLIGPPPLPLPSPSLTKGSFLLPFLRESGIRFQYLPHLFCVLCVFFLDFQSWREKGGKNFRTKAGRGGFLAVQIKSGFPFLRSPSGFSRDMSWSLSKTFFWPRIFSICPKKKKLLSLSIPPLCAIRSVMRSFILFPLSFPFFLSSLFWHRPPFPYGLKRENGWLCKFCSVLRSRRRGRKKRRVWWVVFFGTGQKSAIFLPVRTAFKVSFSSYKPFFWFLGVLFCLLLFLFLRKTDHVI